MGRHLALPTKVIACTLLAASLGAAELLSLAHVLDGTRAIPSSPARGARDAAAAVRRGPRTTIRCHGRRNARVPRDRPADNNILRLQRTLPRQRLPAMAARTACGTRRRRARRHAREARLRRPLVAHRTLDVARRDFDIVERWSPGRAALREATAPADALRVQVEVSHARRR
jgi:hypothetical protein